MAPEKRISRRDLLRAAGVGAAGALLAACQPKVVEVEKEVTRIVKEVVKETIIVAGTPQVVEKEVTKVVKETVVVEKVVEATPKPKAVTSVILWHSYGASDGERFNEHLDRFNERHTDLKIDYDYIPADMDAKIAAVIATGDPPDLSIRSSVPVRWYRDGAVAPLKDLFGTVGLDLGDFYPSPLEACTVEGKLLMLPWNVVTWAAEINTDHAQEAGLDITKPPLDGESLITWAKAMTQYRDEDVIRSGFLLTGSGGHNAVLFGIIAAQWGARRLNEDYTKVIFNETDAPVKAAQWILDALDKHKISSRDVTDRYKAFGGGTGSIFWTGSWTISGYHNTEGLNWMAVPLSTVGDEFITQAHVNGLVMFTTPGRKNERLIAAAEAMKWLSDNQVECLPEMGGASPRASVSNDPKFKESGVPWEYRKPFMDGVEHMFVGSPPILNGNDFNFYQGSTQPVVKAMDPVWAGERSIEEGLAMAEEGLKESLKEHLELA